MTKLIAAAIVAFILIPSTAQARYHHYRYQYRHQIIRTDVLPAVAYYGDGNVEYNSGHIISHPAGCPARAFCGCGVSVRVFGRPIHNLFLASNWFKFPRANPAPGMVAVRNHHVMYIVAYGGNGAATVYDPNSGGHATRVHTRSLRGYAIVNPHGGSRMAGI